MNLLAHLHGGDRLSPVAAAGNLAADVCRRTGSTEYQTGIKLHQQIDIFTDTHPVVKEARTLFPGELRRFSPVILDLVFDYCLSQSWEQWQGGIKREIYIEERLALMLEYSGEIPPQAAQLIRNLQRKKVLQQYIDLAGVERSMQRIVARRPRFAPMLKAVNLLEEQSTLISDTFQKFYPDLLAHIALVKSQST